MTVTVKSETAVPVRDRLSLVWLAIAAGVLVFANGMNVVAFAAWLGPFFLLRFLRTQRAALGLLLGYLVNAAAFYVAWRPAFLDAGRMFTLFSVFFALIFFLPYVIDRLVYPRVRGAAATLVFPVAWVTTEYLLHLVSPLGTFFLLPYTQHTNLALLQIMSVTGMWGVSFLVAWAASVGNFVWERGVREPVPRTTALVYFSVLGAVLLFGGLRIALYPDTAQSVKAAALTTNVNAEVLAEPETPRDRRLIEGTLSAVDRAEMNRVISEINDDLFTRARGAAAAGAGLVTFTEYNVHTWKAEEPQLLERAGQLARDEGIYLSFPLAVILDDPAERPQKTTLVENKSVLFTPDGQLAYQYMKHNLLIGWESEHAVRGPRLVRSVDSPHGKLASVICLDMEYPSFMRLAAAQDVDIVMSGAIDGTPSTKGNPVHSIMASYRCIESGFSLIRGGSYGQNIAADYLGRTVGRVNHYAGVDRTVIAALPISGVRTVYSMVGDLFAWLCLAALVLLAAAAAVLGRTN
jgi:apolipoprotein N-acyltransferase